MAYLSKQTILSAYKFLSTLSPDPTKQGATQRVSALRYFLALDMFYKKNGKSCNTRDKANGKEFVENVGKIVSINGDIYTTNFTNDLSINRDYGVGSNFFSVNTVKNSLSNGGVVLGFPKRANAPLMKVQSGELIFEPSYLKNIHNYIPSDEHKVALVLWLARDVSVEEGDPFDVVFNALSNVFQDNTLSAFKIDPDDFNRIAFNFLFELSDDKSALTGDDIRKCFEPVQTEGNKSFDSASILQQNQIVFYGAPGTGKSYRINLRLKQMKIPSSKIFRTTFHPDTDYSSFVGSYKPTKVVGSSCATRKVLSEDELSDILRKMYNAPVEQYKGKANSIRVFSFLYADYFNGNIAEYAYKDILSKAGIKGKKGGASSYWSDMGDMNTFTSWFNENNPHKASSITYEFVPQVFTKAYVEAWKQPDENVFLVIEEINRGNCAQIFGDLFQLLDRNEDGVSKYPIKADSDLEAFLLQPNQLGEGNDGILLGELKLPGNLFIWATMNTSDQSLFPMDSAFKRRWEQEYVPISYSDASNFVLNINGENLNWGIVLHVINDYIKGTLHSANKLIGNRFIQPRVGNVISYKMFRDKVLFYLFNDVFKDDDSFAEDFFQGNEGYMFFEDLCEKDDPQIALSFIKQLLNGESTETDESAEGDSEEE